MFYMYQKFLNFYQCLIHVCHLESKFKGILLSCVFYLNF